MNDNEIRNTATTAMSEVSSEFDELYRQQMEDVASGEWDRECDRVAELLSRAAANAK